MPDYVRLYVWKDYGGKRSESRFTKFYPDIYRPRRYGFYKRKLQLSSLIVEGQITREEALAEVAEPPIPDDQARQEMKFVAKKLGIVVAALEQVIGSPLRSHLDYPNSAKLYAGLTGITNLFRGVIMRGATRQGHAQ